MPVSRAALVVVAAGSGRRLAGEGPRKALVTLGDEPLVVHALRRLLRVTALDPVVLVGHPHDRDELLALLPGLPRPVTLVDGGARRQDSVAAGLAALDESCEIVLVHDAARPFVPLEPIPELIAGATAAGCAILAVPVADTLKRADPERPHDAAGTVERDGLWAAQTPQAFRRAALVSRLSDARARGLVVTDEARLFETAGLTVRFVKGSQTNFKITTADDLRLARAVVGAYAERAGP